MKPEELEATYKVCERKKRSLLDKVEPGKNPPKWIKEEIKFIESMENLASMYYRKCQEYNKQVQVYERLVVLFQVLETAFFSFVPFRHHFQWYKGRVEKQHINTLTLLQLFSLLPESDSHRRELIIAMINEHITEPVKPEGYGARLRKFTNP